MEAVRVGLVGVQNIHQPWSLTASDGKEVHLGPIIQKKMIRKMSVLELDMWSQG